MKAASVQAQPLINQEKCRVQQSAERMQLTEWRVWVFAVKWL